MIPYKINLGALVQGGSMSVLNLQKSLNNEVGIQKEATDSTTFKLSDLSALSGLSEVEIISELKLSEQNSDSITLEDLRSFMLKYLESINLTMNSNS